MPKFLLVVAFALFFNLFHPRQVDNNINLFNGKDFTGWETYLGPELDTNGKRKSNIPIGINKDPSGVFSVVNVNGEPAIRITGETWGALTTLKSYQNYHLQLKFKWGKLKWGAKRTQHMDSGILFHSSGPYSTGPVWMRSYEFQLEEGNTGDYWGVAGAQANISARQAGKDMAYDANATPILFVDKGPNGRHCLKSDNAENPTGEWNTVDLFCLGSRCIYMVNGKTVMRINNQQQSGNHKAEALSSGKIQLQSEGAEVFFKDISLTTIKQLP